MAINYRSGAGAAEALAAELRSEDQRMVAIGADVSDPEEGRTLVDSACDALGGLDILCSNAGVEHFGSLESITVGDCDGVFGVNVRGRLFVTQAAAAAMDDGARIVLTSSISAVISVFEHTLYAASKAALAAMVRNLAPELARRGIAINAIAPGGTDSDMAAENAERHVHPDLRDLPPERTIKLGNALGRLAAPEEIAATVAFLVSADASYMTGYTLQVDGGRF